MGHPSSYLLVVPNRGGHGEYFSALRLREQIEKADPVAKVTILSRITNKAQEVLANINKREGDITWEVSNESSMGNVEMTLRILNPDIVIEIPYSDTRIQELLQRTLPETTSKFTLGEYSGYGLCLGLGDTEAGVFVDEALLKESKETKIDHEKVLWESLPDSLKTSIQKVEKGKFAFGYASAFESFIDYIQTVSKLGFLLQKKDELTLVLVGTNACNIDIESLGNLEKLGISELTLVIHSMEGPVVEICQKAHGIGKLRMVCLPVLAPSLFDLCLQSTTDLPVLVTGDDSFIKALAVGAITYYEQLEHKIRSYQTFSSAIRDIIPDVNFLSTRDCDGKLAPGSSSEKAEIYQKILINPDPWKTSVFNLLNRKKIDIWAEDFFSTLTKEKAVECERDSRLRKSIQLLALLKRDIVKFSGPIATPDICRELIKRGDEVAFDEALWVASGADDEELFLACEANLSECSEAYINFAYSGAFSMASGLFHLLSSISPHILPLFLTNPERLARIPYDLRMEVFSHCIKEGNTLVISEFLKVDNFLPKEEFFKVLSEGIVSILDQPEYYQDLVLFRLLFSHLTKDNKISILEDILEKFLPNPKLQEEFSRPEYEAVKTLLLIQIIKKGSIVTISKFFGLKDFLKEESKDGPLVDGMQNILDFSLPRRDFVLLRLLFSYLTDDEKLGVMECVFVEFSNNAELITEFSREEYAPYKR